MTSIQDASDIMKSNFIGPTELQSISNKMNLGSISGPTTIPFSTNKLKKNAATHLLILGVDSDKDHLPLTINQMRKFFGMDPQASEPCFYNQDWYINELFAKDTTLENKWYLIQKKVTEESRAVDPAQLLNKLTTNTDFPSAILTAYTFFTYYFLNNKERLWDVDFIWCSDTDANNDRIYTGRYTDPNGVNKNGFNVHRHLALKPNYAMITTTT